MQEVRDCEVCLNGDPIPGIKCCFNCARKPAECEVTHRCAEDCPEWKAKTYADKIRSMSNENLALWISDLAYRGRTPWAAPFRRKFCDNCQKVECTLPDGKTMDMHECDFSDGECPHGSDILWWLSQPAGEHTK